MNNYDTTARFILLERAIKHNPTPDHLGKCVALTGRSLQYSATNRTITSSTRSKGSSQSNTSSNAFVTIATQSKNQSQRNLTPDRLGKCVVLTGRSLQYGATNRTITSSMQSKGSSQSNTSSSAFVTIATQSKTQSQCNSTTNRLGKVITQTRSICRRNNLTNSMINIPMRSTPLRCNSLSKSLDTLPTRSKRPRQNLGVTNIVKRRNNIIRKPNNKHSIFDTLKANFNSPIPAKKETELRFAYINVWHPKELSVVAKDWKTIRVKPFAMAINQLKPDIVALQEMTFSNLITLLNTLTKMKLFYNYIIPASTLRTNFRFFNYNYYSSIKLSNKKIVHVPESKFDDMLKYIKNLINGIEYYTNAFLIAKKPNISLVDFNFYHYNGGCSRNFMPLYITLRVNNKILVFGNTHYPSRSKSTDIRLKCAEKDMSHLKVLNVQKKRFVFGGDLNITVRGKDEWRKDIATINAAVNKIYETFTSCNNIKDCRYAVDAKNRLGTNFTYIRPTVYYELFFKKDGSYYNDKEAVNKASDLVFSNSPLKWFGIFPLFFGMLKKNNNTNPVPTLHPIDKNPYEYLNANKDLKTHIVSDHCIMVGGIDINTPSTQNTFFKQRFSLLSNFFKKTSAYRVR